MTIDSSLVIDLVASDVDFSALVAHQTTSTAGSAVVGTSITFGTGSTCDYPGTFLTSTLDTTTCNDEFSASSIPFASFSPCLTLACFDNNGITVNCADASTCTAPPCSKVWSSNVEIKRDYTVFNGNGVSFPASATAFHPLSFTFPWVESNSFNVATWRTPDIAGSAVITSVTYSPTLDSWSVVVSTSLDWPYQLQIPPTQEQINTEDYTVSACASAPSTTVPCVQTISFSIATCAGLHSIFGGNPASYTGLKYECVDYTAVDCPLATGDIRDATITIDIDSNSACGTVANGVTLTQSDIGFAMTQSDFAVTRNSFVFQDDLDFLVKIAASIPQAAISGISVVSFTETTLHGALGNLEAAVIPVTTPASPCASPNALCFTFDSSLLTNIPTALASATFKNLTFVAVVSIDYNGISKRSVLETSWNWWSGSKRAVSSYSLNTRATVEADTSGSKEVSTFGFFSALLAVVISVLFY